MKSNFTRTATAVALSLGFGIAAPVAAFASGHQPTTSVHGSARAQANATALRAYATAKLNINLAFKSTLAAARTTMQTALSAATTDAARTAAQSAYRTALKSAISARQSAFATLGKPPVANATAASTLNTLGRAYGVSILAINQTFKSTVSAARTVYTAALRTATTSADRVSARNVFKLALTGAITARQTSIAALGTPPTKP